MHLVMTQPAQFRARDFINPSSNRSEVHVDRKTRHHVLLEPHRRNKKAVDHILSAQDHFHFAIYWRVHRSAHDVVFGSSVRRVQTDGALAARRRIDQFRLRSAKLAVRPRIPEIPRKLHSGDLHLQGLRFRRCKTLRRPNVSAHQVEPDKQDQRQHRPHNLQRIVPVRIRSLGGRFAFAVLPGKQSQNYLRRHKHNAHQYVSRVEVMVNSRSRRGGSGWQPPCLGDKEVRADESDQPDDDQKYEAHAARPPSVDSRPAPLWLRLQSLDSHQWGCNRRESTTAHSLRKCVLLFWSAAVLFTLSFEGPPLLLSRGLSTTYPFCA